MNEDILVELEITELYYELVGRKPEEKALNYFKNKMLNEQKTLDWVSKKIVEFKKDDSKNKST